MISQKAIIEQLKIDELFREKLYKCPAGKWTIGYGWNIEDTGISEGIAEIILYRQVEQCEAELYENFKWFPDLPDRIQEALVNMCFNLGISRLKTFKNMISAFERHDYENAALEMRDSKWYRQVGERAKRLVRIVSGGKYD